MARFALCFLVTAWAVIAADPTLDVLLKSVESRYNRAQTLRLSFTETYKQKGHSDQVESGTLSLRKPGRMRWDYTSPAGKVFVSDGKNVFLYTPDTNRVERSTLKESEDLRAPLAFLLGKLNFYKEFRAFSLRPDAAGTWITAVPNSDQLPYSQVEFLVTPQRQIRRLRVAGQDHSTLEFAFEGETLNPALDAKSFAFRPPPGAEVVETEQ